ncbi:hypothetical protein LNP74_06075 [Klebsiella pneumoniae subsp. pneumoniae]|nr:hypothetical protein [Klebsiella pneumoniae subsp. pneumoniae]
MRDEYQLAIVLITHEMDAVRTAADAVAEIRDGTIVQYGRIEDLLARPDSLLGQQLLPLTPAAATHSDLLLRHELPLGCAGGHRLDQPPEPAVGAADRSPWRSRRGD